MAAGLIVPVIQARMGGTRFPGKVMAKFNGLPLLAYQYAAAREAFPGVPVILATGDRSPVGSAYGHVIVGSEDDVLARFVKVADDLNLPNEAIIVRLTADDPCKLPALLRLAARVVQGGQPYADTNHGHVEGLGAEAFTVALLREADAHSWPQEREHVTPYMRRLYGGKPISLTVDHPEDIARVEALWT